MWYQALYIQIIVYVIFNNEYVFIMVIYTW